MLFHSNYSCEYFSKNSQNHLRLRNLNEYNIDYLKALFSANKSRIYEYESFAAQQGFGPLAPCNEVSIARGKKELCCE